MQITDLFIRRPVLSIVVTLVILIAGLQALRSLNVRQYPRNENSSITITTTYVGASPELVRGFLTTPLERSIASADGIDYLESTSALSVSTITARLKLNYDPTKALAEIGSKVDQVRGDLPPEAEVPLINITSADSQFATAYLSFGSDLLQQNEITDYLARVVQPRLTAVEGVQRAEILGGRTFAMRIWLKPERMAALNISPAQVRAALSANNYLAAVGKSKGQFVQVNLTTDTDLKSVAEFKRMQIREAGGTVVRLEDIADVVLGAEDYDAEVRFSGQTAVFMGIFVLPNANALDVIKGIRKEMDGLQKDLPTGMKGQIAFDGTSYITGAIDEVVGTLGETLLIVVAVIFLFLGSLRSAIVPVIAIPVSLIGAVFLMQIFGFTVNLLTLLAVVLSVGIVVDDAIVVVENVERHMRDGQSPTEAAMKGARELVGPVIAMTITLAAVYTPIALQGGLTGSLFREFAMTLAGAVLISGIVALTLSPMMTSKMLRAKDAEAWFPRKIHGVFERLKSGYRRALGGTLNARPAVYSVWLILTLCVAPMIMFSGKELAPTEDQGVIFSPIVDAPSNSTIDETLRYTEAANKLLLSTPESWYTFQVTQPATGFAGLVLKPWDKRDRTASQILPEVQRKISALPGIKMYPLLPPALPGGGNFPVEVVLTATDEQTKILGFAEQIQRKALESGKFMLLQIDTKLDQPENEIVIDRDKVASLGLNLQQVGADLGAAIGGNFVNRFNIEGRSYKVIAQVKRDARLNPSDLQNLHVSGPGGQLIPLSQIAKNEMHATPRQLSRFQQLNAVKLSGVSMLSLDESLKFLESSAAEIAPPGYGVDYTGESRQLRVEGNSFVTSFTLAVVLIFLVLAAQFNSFRDPLVILLGSVPLAIFGASIFMFLKMPNPNMTFFTDGWTTTFNIYAQVGLVTLVGLVAKNGILIVEFANEQQRHGLSKLEAVREAAVTRLRPVLMTTCATVFGHFPLTLVSGAGAAARNSIGLVIVSGMTIGTLFTLFVLPSLYVLLAKQHAASEDELPAEPATLPPAASTEPASV
ncbi:MAG TPA: efflux RND transporter permease subunit [Polyangiales bacterium]|nr:efflux RND transporter permease subunit [Polyangiales bacterium]